MYQVPTNRPMTPSSGLIATPTVSSGVELPTTIPTAPSVPTRLSGFDFVAEHYNNLLRQMRLGQYSLSDPLAINAVAQRVSKQVNQMPTILSELSFPVDYSGSIALNDAFRNAREVEREVGLVYANEVLEELASKGATSVPDHIVQEIFQLINNAPLPPEQLPRYKELLNRDLEQYRMQKRAMPHAPSRAKTPKPVIDFYKGLARIATDSNALLQNAERQAIADALDGIRHVRQQFQKSDLVFTRDLHRAIQETGAAAPILKNIFGYGTGEPLGGVLQGRALVRYLTNLESQLKQVVNNGTNRQIAAANVLARTPGPLGNDIEASLPTNSVAQKARRVAIGYLRFLPFMQTALEAPQSAPEVAKQFLVTTADGKKRLPTLPEYAQILQQQHAQIAQQVKRLVPLLRQELTIIREAMRKAPNQTWFQKFTRVALTGNELEETLNVLFDALDRLERNPADEQAFVTLYRYLEPMLQGAEQRTGRDTRWLQYVTPALGAALQAATNTIDALKNRIGLGFVGDLGNITGRGRTAAFMYLNGLYMPTDVANRFVDTMGQLVFYRTLLNQAMPVYPNPIDRAMGELGMDPRIPRNAARIAFATTIPGAVYDILSSFRGTEEGEPSVVMTGLGAAVDTGMISPSNALMHWMYPYLNAVGLTHRSPLGVSQPTDIYPVPRLSMQAHPSYANFIVWSMANPTTGVLELATTIGAAASGVGLGAKAAQWSAQAARAVRGIALGARIAQNASRVAESAGALGRIGATLEAANVASRASKLTAAHRISLALGGNIWHLLNALGDRGDITEFIENIPADSTAERVFRAISDPNLYLVMLGQGSVIAPFTQSYQSLRRAYQYFKPSVRNTAEYLIGYSGNYLDEVQRYYAPDRADLVSGLQAVMELPTQRVTGYVGLRRAGGIVWAPIKQINSTRGISGEPSITFVAVDENGQDVLVDPSDLNALIVPKTPVANAGAYSQIVLSRALATGNLSAPDAYWHAMLGDVNAVALKQMQVLTPTANGEYQLNPQLYQALRQNLFANNTTALDEQLALALAARDAAFNATDRADYEQQLVELYRANRERLQDARPNERIATRFQYLMDLLDGLDSNIGAAMVYDALLERVQQNMPTAGAFRVMNENGELVPVAGTVYALPISQLNALGVGGEALLNLLAIAPDVDFYVDSNGNAYVGIDGQAALEYLRDPETLAQLRAQLAQINSAFYTNAPAEMSAVLNAPISGLYDIATMLNVPLAVQPNLEVSPDTAVPSAEQPVLSTETVSETPGVEPQPVDESFTRTVADILRERRQAAEAPDAEYDFTPEVSEETYDFTAEPQQEQPREKRETRPRGRKRTEPVIRFQAIEREEQQPIDKRQVINALKELSQLILPGGASGLKTAREIRAIYRQYRLRQKMDSLVRTAVSDLSETLRHMAQSPREIDALALRILTQRLDHVLDKLNVSGARRDEIRNTIVQIFENEIERYHHRVRVGPMFLTGRTKNIQSLMGQSTEHLQSEIRRSAQSIEKYYRNYVILFEILKLDFSKLDKRTLMDVVFEIRERAREIQTFDDFIEYWSSEENSQYREAYAHYLESRLEEFQREYDDLGANYNYYIRLLREARPQEGVMDFLRWALSNMGYDREVLAAAAMLNDIEVDDEMHKEILHRMRLELARLVDVRDYERKIDLTDEEFARSDAILWFIAREFAQKWITNQIAPDRRDEHATRVARALFHGDVYNREIDAPQHILDWVQSKIEYYRDEKQIAYTETDVYKRDFFAYISSRIAGRVPVVAANAFLEELWHALVFRLQVMDIPRELLYVLEPLVYDMGGTITQASAKELLKKWTVGVRETTIMRGIPIPDEPVTEDVFARIRQQTEAYEEDAVAAALESLLGEIVHGAVTGGITKAEQLFLLDTFRYWLQRYGVSLDEALEHPNLVKWFETFLVLAYKRNEDEMYLADILRERLYSEDEELPEITTIFPPRPLENAAEQLDKLYRKVYESGYGIWFRDIDSLFGTTPTGRFQAFDRIVGRRHVGFEDVIDWLEHHSEAARGNVRPPRGHEPPRNGRWQRIDDIEDVGYPGRTMPTVATLSQERGDLPISARIWALWARITPNLLASPEKLAQAMQEAVQTSVNPMEHGTWEIHRVGEDGSTTLKHILSVDGQVVAEATYTIERGREKSLLAFTDREHAQIGAATLGWDRGLRRRAVRLWRRIESGQPISKHDLETIDAYINALERRKSNLIRVANAVRRRLPQIFAGRSSEELAAITAAYEKAFRSPLTDEERQLLRKAAAQITSISQKAQINSALDALLDSIPTIQKIINELEAFKLQEQERITGGRKDLEAIRGGARLTDHHVLRVVYTPRYRDVLESGILLRSGDQPAVFMDRQLRLNYIPDSLMGHGIIPGAFETYLGGAEEYASVLLPSSVLASGEFTLVNVANNVSGRQRRRTAVTEFAGRVYTHYPLIVERIYGGNPPSLRDFIAELESRKVGFAVFQLNANLDSAYGARYVTAGELIFVTYDTAQGTQTDVFFVSRYNDQIRLLGTHTPTGQNNTIDVPNLNMSADEVDQYLGLFYLAPTVPYQGVAETYEGQLENLEFRVYPDGSLGLHLGANHYYPVVSPHIAAASARPVAAMREAIDTIGQSFGLDVYDTRYAYQLDWSDVMLNPRWLSSQLSVTTVWQRSEVEGMNALGLGVYEQNGRYYILQPEATAKLRALQRLFANYMAGNIGTHTRAVSAVLSTTSRITFLDANGNRRTESVAAYLNRMSTAANPNLNQRIQSLDVEVLSGFDAIATLYMRLDATWNSDWIVSSIMRVVNRNVFGQDYELGGAEYSPILARRLDNIVRNHPVWNQISRLSEEERGILYRFVLTEPEFAHRYFASTRNIQMLAKRMAYINRRVAATGSERLFVYFDTDFQFGTLQRERNGQYYTEPNSYVFLTPRSEKMSLGEHPTRLVYELAHRSEQTFILSIVREQPDGTVHLNIELNGDQLADLFFKGELSLDGLAPGMENMVVRAAVSFPDLLDFALERMRKYAVIGGEQYATISEAPTRMLEVRAVEDGIDIRANPIMRELSDLSYSVQQFLEQYQNDRRKNIFNLETHRMFLELLNAVSSIAHRYGVYEPSVLHRYLEQAGFVENAPAYRLMNNLLTMFVGSFRTNTTLRALALGQGLFYDLVQHLIEAQSAADIERVVRLFEDVYGALRPYHPLGAWYGTYSIDYATLDPEVQDPDRRFWQRHTYRLVDLFEDPWVEEIWNQIPDTEKEWNGIQLDFRRFADFSGFLSFDPEARAKAAENLIHTIGILELISDFINAGGVSRLDGREFSLDVLKLIDERNDSPDLPYESLNMYQRFKAFHWALERMVSYTGRDDDPTTFSTSFWSAIISMYIGPSRIQDERFRTRHHIDYIAEKVNRGRRKNWATIRTLIRSEGKGTSLVSEKALNDAIREAFPYSVAYTTSEYAYIRDESPEKQAQLEAATQQLKEKVEKTQSIAKQLLDDRKTRLEQMTKTNESLIEKEKKVLIEMNNYASLIKFARRRIRDADASYRVIEKSLQKIERELKKKFPRGKPDRTWHKYSGDIGTWQYNQDLLEYARLTKRREELIKERAEIDAKVALEYKLIREYQNKQAQLRSSFTGEEQKVLRDIKQLKREVRVLEKLLELLEQETPVPPSEVKEQYFKVVAVPYVFRAFPTTVVDPVMFGRVYSAISQYKRGLPTISVGETVVRLLEDENIESILDVASMPPLVDDFIDQVSSPEAEAFVSARSVRVALSVPAAHKALKTAYQRYLEQTKKSAQEVPVEVFIVGMMDALNELVRSDPRKYRRLEDGVEQAFYGTRGAMTTLVTQGAPGSSAYPIIGAITNAIIAGNPSYSRLSSTAPTLDKEAALDAAESLLRTLETEWAEFVRRTKDTIEIEARGLDEHFPEYGLAQVLLGFAFVNGSLDNVGYLQTSRAEYLRLAKSETTLFEKTLHSPISALAVAALYPELRGVYTRSSVDWLEIVAAAYMLPEFQRAVLDMSPNDAAYSVLNVLLGDTGTDVQQETAVPLSVQIRMLADLFEATGRTAPIQADLKNLPRVNEAISRIHQASNILTARATDPTVSDREKLDMIAEAIRAMLDGLEVYLDTGERVGNLSRDAINNFRTTLETLQQNPPSQDRDYYMGLAQLADAMLSLVSPGSGRISINSRPLTSDNINQLIWDLDTRFTWDIFSEHLSLMARRASGGLGIEFVEADVIPQDDTSRAQIAALQKEREVGIRAAFVASGYSSALADTERRIYEKTRGALAYYLAAIARDESGVRTELNRLAVAATSMDTVAAHVKNALAAARYDVSDPDTDLVAANIAMILRTMAVNANAELYGDLFNARQSAYVLDMFGIDIAEASGAPNVRTVAENLKTQFEEAIRARRTEKVIGTIPLTDATITEIVHAFTQGTPSQWRRIADILESDKISASEKNTIVTALAGAFRYTQTSHGALALLRGNVQNAYTLMSAVQNNQTLPLDISALIASLVDISDIAHELNSGVPLSQMGIYTLGSGLRSYKMSSTMLYPKVVGDLGKLRSEVEPIIPLVEKIAKAVGQLDWTTLRETASQENALGLFTPFWLAVHEALTQQLNQLDPVRKLAYKLSLERFLPRIMELIKNTPEEQRQLVERFIAFALAYDAEYADAKRAAQIYWDGHSIFDTSRDRAPQDLFQAIVLRTVYFTMRELPITWTSEYESVSDLDDFLSFSREFILARDRLVSALAQFIESGTRAYTLQQNPFIVNGAQPDARLVLNQAMFSVLMMTGELLWRAEQSLRSEELRSVFQQMETIANAARRAATHLDTILQNQSQAAAAEQQAAALSPQLQIRIQRGRQAEQQTAQVGLISTTTGDPLADAFLGAEVPTTVVNNRPLMTPEDYIQNLLSVLFPTIPSAQPNETEAIRRSIMTIVTHLSNRIAEKRRNLTQSLQAAGDYGTGKRVRFVPWLREYLYDDFMEHAGSSIQEETVETQLSEARGTGGWIRRIMMTTLPHTNVLSPSDYRTLRWHSSRLAYWHKYAGETVFRGLYPDMEIPGVITTGLVPIEARRILEELALHRITKRYNPLGEITIPGVVMTVREAMEEMYWSTRHTSPRLHDGDMFLVNASTIELFLLLNIFGLVPVVGQNKRVVNLVFNPAEARKNIDIRFRNYLKQRYVSLYYDYTPRAAGLSEQAIDRKIQKLLEYHDNIVDLIADGARVFPDMQDTELGRGVINFVKMLLASRQEARIPQLIFTHEFAQYLYEVLRRPDRQTDSGERQIGASPVSLAETYMLVDEVTDFLDLIYEVGRGTQVDRTNTELVHMAHMLSRPVARTGHSSPDSTVSFTQQRMKIVVNSNQQGTTIHFVPAQAEKVGQISITVNRDSVAKKIADAKRRVYRRFADRLLRDIRRGKAADYDGEQVLAFLRILRDASEKRRMLLLLDTQQASKTIRARGRLKVAEDYLDTLIEFIEQNGRLPEAGEADKIFWMGPIEDLLEIAESLNEAVAQPVSQETVRRVEIASSQAKRRRQRLSALKDEIPREKYNKMIESIENIEKYLDELYQRFSTAQTLTQEDVRAITEKIRGLRYSIAPEAVTATYRAISDAFANVFDELGDNEILNTLREQHEQLFKEKELMQVAQEIPITVRIQRGGETIKRRYRSFRQVPIWQREIAGKIDLYQWLLQYLRHVERGEPSENYRYISFMPRHVSQQLLDAMDVRPLSLDVPVGESETTLGEQIELSVLPEAGSVIVEQAPTPETAHSVRRRRLPKRDIEVATIVANSVGESGWTQLLERLINERVRLEKVDVVDLPTAISDKVHITIVDRNTIEQLVDELFSRENWRTVINDLEFRYKRVLLTMPPQLQEHVRQQIIAKFKDAIPAKSLLVIDYSEDANAQRRLGQRIITVNRRLVLEKEEAKALEEQVATKYKTMLSNAIREFPSIALVYKMLYTTMGEPAESGTAAQKREYQILQHKRHAFVRGFELLTETELYPHWVLQFVKLIRALRDRNIEITDERRRTMLENVRSGYMPAINRVANSGESAVLHRMIERYLNETLQDALRVAEMIVDKNIDRSDDDTDGGGGGSGPRRIQPPPLTRQYRPSRREQLFGLSSGGRFQTVRRVFSSRTGITITSDENLRPLRTALQLMRGLAGNQHNKALMNEETLMRLMYGDRKAIDEFLDTLSTRLPQEASVREAYLRQLQNQALYALVRHLSQHLGILSDILFNILTTVEHTNNVYNAIRAEVNKHFESDKAVEYEKLILRLLPFFETPLADAVNQRIGRLIPPMRNFTDLDAARQATLFPILSVLNVAYILTHYSVLVDHRRNLPHETTFNTQARVPLYGERSYDGRTEATFITYAPILTEYQLLSEDEASATLSERYTREHQVDLEKLWIHVPIGSDDSDNGIVLPALSEPALVMVELYLDLREREAQKSERNQQRAEHGAGIELIRHQRELISYARKADATQLPVWLYVGNEVTALAARIGGREWNRLRIGKTTMNLPISFMPRLREWLRRTKLDEFFMNFAPVNAPRSVPIRLSRIAAVIGRLIKTTVDLTGGGLISASQNLLYNALNRDAWRAFGAGLLFGWAPYASAGVVYRWYERLGRTRRGLDANGTYFLLGLQFDAMREYTAGHAAQNTDWFQNTSFREAEHLPLVFSTSNRQLHELYLDLRNALEPIVGAEYADTAVELLLIRAHLDDDVWHERNELFYEKLRRLVIGEKARIRTEDELYAYLGTDQLEDLETDDGVRIYAAQRYLNAIEHGEIVLTRVRYKYWNNGTSMLFKLHNRFYTRLMREHGVIVREPIAALILMEHLLINATLANYLQRVGIGSGVMRPEGLFAGTTVMDVGSEPAESDDASGYIYRGLGRQLWFIRKLYDGYLWTKSAITGLNALYNNLPASWRSLNAAVSLLMFGTYLTGSLNPFTMPIFFVSSFFTLSNFLSKITWVSHTGFELQRDIRAYYASVRPVGEVSMLVNTSDTNRLLRLFNEQLAIMRQANQAAAAGDAVGFRSMVQFPPDSIVQTAGATKMILETRGSDTEILLSEPHAIALLAMVQRPDLLPVYLQQLKALRDELPRVQELIDYVNAYTREFQTLGVSYTVKSHVLNYDGEEYTVYFLHVEREIDGERQVRYYELSWFRENIDTIIARYERVLQKYNRLMSDEYRQQIEAAEATLMFLMERQRQLMDFPDAVLMSEPFEQLAYALEPIVNELVGSTMPMVHGAGFAKEVNLLRSTLQRIMLYSARAEAALNELAYHDLETDIRNDAMLETLTSHEAYRDTLEEARELAREYESRVISPVRRYLLETFLVPVAYRNTILQVVRGTLPHFVLAPNVLLSQLSVILGSMGRVLRWLGFRSGSTRPLGEYETRLLERGQGARIAVQLAYATLVLVFILLGASAYCISPTIQSAYDASGMDNIFEFECRSGRFAAMSVGIGEHKLTLRPAYTIDLATRYVYHILRLARRPLMTDIETRTNTIPDIVAGLGRETLEWLSVRVPPLEQSAVEFATRAIRELGLAAAPGAFEFSAYETILQNEDAVLTGYHFLDDMISMLTNNFTPMALENLREVLAVSVGGNMRAGFWHWFFNDEAISTHLTQKPRMSEPNRIYGYPLGLPDMKRVFQAAPYAASSASVRAVRPYNPLNQIQADTPTLYALGYYTPKGAIESTVPLDGTTLAEATRSYSSRVDRNEDYNRILRALDPLIYSVLELQIVQPQVGNKEPYTLRDFLNDQNYHYSPLIGTPVEVRQLVAPLRAEQIMQPSRLIRRAMMLYEYLYLLEPQKLHHMSQYRKFAAQRYGADPSTINGIIRAGADYATAQHKRPFARLLSDKPQASDAYRGIQLYHLYATAELYRMLGMAIDPQYTENMVFKLSKAVHDPSKKDAFSAAEAYSLFINSMHAWITQAIEQQMQADGVPINKANLRAYYERLLHQSVATDAYERSYSPSFYVGDMFALGMFFAQQDQTIIDVIRTHARRVNALARMFGERSTRRSN